LEKLHGKEGGDIMLDHFGCSWVELNQDGRIYVQIFAGQC